MQSKRALDKKIIIITAMLFLWLSEAPDLCRADSLKQYPPWKGEFYATF